MSKKNKIMVAVCIVLAAVIIILIGMYIVLRKCDDSKAKVLENNWKINFPIELKEEYSISTPTSFHGDGYRYIVFVFENNDGFLEDFSEPKAQFEQKFDDCLSKAKLEGLNIDLEKLPDFTGGYSWKIVKKDDNMLYMVYVQSKLYTLQDFK